MTDDDRQFRDSDGGDSGEEYDVICEICGKETTVPFEPKSGRSVYCTECYLIRKEKHDEKKEKKAPRKTHGTRVSFPITCARCGAEETLDYVPKGVKLSEALCSDCVRETHGEQSRWSQVSEKKRQEQKGEWEITCARCGRTDYLKFEPKPDKDYYCVRCFHQHEEPSPDRLEDKKQVGRAVYVRRPGDDDSE